MYTAEAAVSQSTLLPKYCRVFIWGREDVSEWWRALARAFAPNKQTRSLYIYSIRKTWWSGRSEPSRSWLSITYLFEFLFHFLERLIYLKNIWRCPNGFMALYTYFSMRVFLITTHSCVGKRKKGANSGRTQLFLVDFDPIDGCDRFSRQSIRLGNKSLTVSVKETRYINYMRESERGWNRTQTYFYCVAAVDDEIDTEMIKWRFHFLFHRIPLFFLCLIFSWFFCFIDFKLHGWDGAQTVRNTSCLGGRGWAADDLRCVSFAQFCRQINSLSSSKNRFPFFSVYYIPAVSFNLPLYLTPFRLEITYRMTVAAAAQTSPETAIEREILDDLRSLVTFEVFLSLSQLY